MSIFGHYVSRGTLILSLIEALVFGSVFLIFGYFVLGGARGEGIFNFATDVVLPTGLVMVCLLIAGGYHLDVWKSPRSMARRVAAGAIGGSAAIVFIHDVITGAGSTSYGLILATLVGCLLAGVGRLIGGRSSRLQGYLQKKVMILGTGQQAATLWALMQPVPVRADKLFGFLRYGSELKEDHTADHRLPADRIREADLALTDYALANNINEIIIAFDSPDELLPERALLDCRLNGISVIDSVSFVERETGRIGVDSVSLRWLVFSPGFRRGKLKAAAKRLADIAISGTALALLSPLMLATALVVKWDSPGPALFEQIRVGLGGKPFSMYKFRSMRQDAEANGKAQWATKNDQRITRVGKFLRLTRLDELPQLYNVLRGDMSLVGPRPERPEFVTDLSEQIPFYMERHSVRPGITGWAQTSFAYAATIEDTKIKLEYDLYYVKNHSLFLDLLVLIQTFRVAVRGDGAR
ncbi:MAG: TIGR03013 family XrtA/PEP-CTERM system glycosyltransferase [Geminicoccaceae bacterium]